MRAESHSDFEAWRRGMMIHGWHKNIPMRGKGDAERNEESEDKARDEAA